LLYAYGTNLACIRKTGNIFCAVYTVYTTRSSLTCPPVGCCLYVPYPIFVCPVSYGLYCHMVHTIHTACIVYTTPLVLYLYYYYLYRTTSSTTNTSSHFNVDDNVVYLVAYKHSKGGMKKIGQTAMWLNASCPPLLSNSACCHRHTHCCHLAHKVLLGHILTERHSTLKCIK
jgi:hypothetical protein